MSQCRNHKTADPRMIVVQVHNVQSLESRRMKSGPPNYTSRRVHGSTIGCGEKLFICVKLFNHTSHLIELYFWHYNVYSRTWQKVCSKTRIWKFIILALLNCWLRKIDNFSSAFLWSPQCVGYRIEFSENCFPSLFFLTK